MNSRARLCHKLRDGAYRARQLGFTVVTIRIAEAEHLLAQTRCYYCSVELLDVYELEHIIPLARGGSHDLDNLTKACTPCNKAKNTKTEDEFLAWLEGTN